MPPAGATQGYPGATLDGLRAAGRVGGVPPEASG